jgi:putative tryptophan/tyrosine transport system substrate-binding protein
VKKGESFVDSPAGFGLGASSADSSIFRLFRFWTTFEFLEETMQAKFLFYLFAAAILTALHPAIAQQPPKMPQIGFVTVSGDPNKPGLLVEAFRRGLHDLGYVEGKNIRVEYRYPGGEPDRVSGSVAELVQLKVDVLVSSSTGALRAAKQATKSIPIVMVASFDPVEMGMVESLARPGGNITGLSRLTRELSGKRLELFKEAVPGISRVGVLAARGFGGLKDYEPAAHELKMPLQYLEVQGPNPDLEGAFQAAAKGRVNALITAASSQINRHRKQIVELATKNRLPSMFEVSVWVEAGGLLSYSADDAASFRRAAYYVDKILKGAKPADLPVEQPTKFEFVINLKTAKQIGLTIPPNVLARVDKVIR